MSRAGPVYSAATQITPPPTPQRSTDALPEGEVGVTHLSADTHPVDHPSTHPLSSTHPSTSSASVEPSTHPSTHLSTPASVDYVDSGVNGDCVSADSVPVPADFVDGSADFPHFLRAFYAFHPPLDSSSTTITLPLNGGDLILVHSVHTNGWADGTLLATGARGWLPTNYCAPYTPPLFRPLAHACLAFWDLFRADPAGLRLDLLASQEYMRGLIAGVRLLLERTGCLTRDAPNIQRREGLRRHRKALLADLSALVRLTRELAHSVAPLPPPLPEPELDIEALVDAMVLKACKIVVRGVNFLDVWEAVAGGDQASGQGPGGDRGSGAGADPRESGSRSGGDPADPRGSHSIPPTPPAETTSFDPPASTHGLHRLSTTPMHRLSAHGLHRLSAHRASASGCGPVSGFHRLSYSGQSSGWLKPNLASSRLNATHDAFLSHQGSFIGRLHLQSRSSTELLTTTQQSVTACRGLLLVVDAVRRQDAPRAGGLDVAKDGMYARITDLVQSTRDVFGAAGAAAGGGGGTPNAAAAAAGSGGGSGPSGPAGTGPTSPSRPTGTAPSPSATESGAGQPSLDSSGTGAECEIITPDESRVLMTAATSCVRAAGECVAKAKFLIERVGDFELEEAELRALDGLQIGEPEAAEAAEGGAVDAVDAATAADMAVRGGAAADMTRGGVAADMTRGGAGSGRDTVTAGEVLDRVADSYPGSEGRAAASGVDSEQVQDVGVETGAMADVHQGVYSLSHTNLTPASTISNSAYPASTADSAYPPSTRSLTTVTSATTMTDLSPSLDMDTETVEWNTRSLRIDTAGRDHNGASVGVDLQLDTSTSAPVSALVDTSTPASTPASVTSSAYAAADASASTSTPASVTSAYAAADASASASVTSESSELETEAKLLLKTHAHELIYNKDGQIMGGTLPALVERLTTHDSTPDSTFVSTFYLTFRLFTTPRDFAAALVTRFEDVADTAAIAGPVRLRVYNVFKGWLESQWSNESDRDALPVIFTFAMETLQPVMPSAGERMIALIERASTADGPLVPRIVPAIGRAGGVCIGSSTGLTPSTTLPKPTDPAPSPSISKSQLNLLKSWKASTGTVTGPSILDIDALELARQITLKESKIFCSILPEELLGAEWMKKTSSKAVNVKAMSRLSTNLSTLVADTILSLDDVKKRAATVKQWIKIAKKCLSLNNYDSMFAIVCSLNNSTIIRLKRTWELVSSKAKATFEQLRGITEVKRNYAVLRQRLTNHVPPCLPFVGTYLTDLTFVDVGNQTTRQLPCAGAAAGSAGSTPPGGGPTQDAVSVINFDKYMKTAKIIYELQRFQVPYNLVEIPELQSWMESQIQRIQRGSDADDVQGHYRRSLLLEPRETCTPSQRPSISDGAGGGGAGNSFSAVTKEKFDFLIWHKDKERVAA